MKIKLKLTDNKVLSKKRLEFLSNHFEINKIDYLQKIVSKTDNDLKKGFLPDMTNYNITDASFILNNYGIHVELSGRGKVVNQIPEPGTRLKDIKKITLFLM